MHDMIEAFTGLGQASRLLQVRFMTFVWYDKIGPRWQWYRTRHGIVIGERPSLTITVTDAP